MTILSLLLAAMLLLIVAYMPEGLEIKLLPVRQRIVCAILGSSVFLAAVAGRDNKVLTMIAVVAIGGVFVLCSVIPTIFGMGVMTRTHRVLCGMFGIGMWLDVFGSALTVALENG